jgi:hypothetical protein
MNIKISSFCGVFLVLVMLSVPKESSAATVIINADASLTNMSLVDQRSDPNFYGSSVTGPSATWTAGFSVQVTGGTVSMSSAFFTVNGGSPTYIESLSLTNTGDEFTASPYLVAYLGGTRITAGTVGNAVFDEFYIGGIGNGAGLLADPSNRTVGFGAFFDISNPAPIPGPVSATATYVVPEPGTVFFVCIGITCILLRRCRRTL